MDCLFCAIAEKSIPADIVYEDDQIIAFRDIQPQAPTHVLVIPKKPIPRVAETTNDDKAVMGHLMVEAGRLAGELGLHESGFRLVINNGKDGGESVPHLHCHILGGRSLSWPPG